MAALHGKKSGFSIDNAAGTPVDITEFCEEVNFPRTVDTDETSAMGTEDKTYVVGLRDAKISIKGKYDAASSTTPDPVLSGILGGDAGTFEYKADGTAATSATNPAYTGEAFCVGYDITSSIGGKVTFSAEFQVTGPVTRATS